jgi:hypothetical protein
MSGQIGYPLLDQDPVPLPFDEGLLQELDDPLGLPGIVAAGLQITEQLLLIA